MHSCPRERKVPVKDDSLFSRTGPVLVQTDTSVSLARIQQIKDTYAVVGFAENAVFSNERPYKGRPTLILDSETPRET